MSERGRISGFTIVELLITIVIATALLALGVAGVRNLQTYARDDQREADIAAIARGLEQYYQRGNSYKISDTKGTYPGANEMFHIAGSGYKYTSGTPASCNGAYFTDDGMAAKFSPCYVAGGYLTQAFPGTTRTNFIPPNKTTPQFLTSWLQPERSPVTILNDWIENELDNGNYIYKPMGGSSYALCYENCQRYALLYKEEVTGNIITVRSKHQ